eukprot:scaffold243770_cov24-Tisochrysis_lutea.AAC.2
MRRCGSTSRLAACLRRRATPGCSPAEPSARRLVGTSSIAVAAPPPGSALAPLADGRCGGRREWARLCAGPDGAWRPSVPSRAPAPRSARPAAPPPRPPSRWLPTCAPAAPVPHAACRRAPEAARHWHPEAARRAALALARAAVWLLPAGTAALPTAQSAPPAWP